LAVRALFSSLAPSHCFTSIVILQHHTATNKAHCCTACNITLLYLHHHTVSNKAHGCTACNVTLLHLHHHTATNKAHCIAQPQTQSTPAELWRLDFDFDFDLLEEGRRCLLKEDREECLCCFFSEGPAASDASPPFMLAPLASAFGVGKYSVLCLMQCDDAGEAE